MPNAQKKGRPASHELPAGFSQPHGPALAGPSQSAEPAPSGMSQPADSSLSGLSQLPEPSSPGASRATPSAGPSHWQSESQPSHPRGISPTLLSDHAGHGQDSSEQEGPLREDERRASLNKLESFITQFREGHTSKTTAFAGIVSTIVNLTLSESKKDKTIKLYSDKLESIHRDAEPQPSRAGKSRSIVAFKHQTDHASIADNSIDGSQAADSDDPDSPKKKRKLTASDVPWYESDNRSLLALPASCIQTCKCLELYLQDIPGCRNHIKVAPGAPRNVPISQWERIFRGETLDLDHFLSSLYCTTVDEEGETRIGNARISFGVSDAKKHVNSASEWTSAWRLASKAISFAFPHRTAELDAYSDYIEGEFSAKVTASHPRVIMFDVAVRNLVQGGQSCLLTDHQSFSRLYSAILMPDRAESTPKKNSNNRQSNTSTRNSGSKSSTDICNRFNTALGCPSSDADCKYRHICKNCKKGGHGKENCPK